MPVLGKKSFLIQHIKAKTKIKEQDILDVLDAIPDALAEAFLIENPPEKKQIHFGFIMVYWKQTRWGPSVAFKSTKPFRDAIIKHKLQQKYPLAQKLLSLMPSFNLKRSLDRVNKQKHSEV